MFLAGVDSCREAVSVFPLPSAKLHRAAISCVALSQTVSDVHWLFLRPLRKNLFVSLACFPLWFSIVILSECAVCVISSVSFSLVDLAASSVGLTRGTCPCRPSSTGRAWSRRQHSREVASALVGAPNEVVGSHYSTVALEHREMCGSLGLVYPSPPGGTTPRVLGTAGSPGGSQGSS